MHMYSVDMRAHGAELLRVWWAPRGVPQYTRSSHGCGARVTELRELAHHSCRCAGKTGFVPAVFVNHDYHVAWFVAGSTWYRPDMLVSSHRMLEGETSFWYTVCTGEGSRFCMYYM